MNGYLKPKEIALATVDVGYNKANKSPIKLVLLGILAGMYIALGGIGATTIGALVADKGMAKLLFSAVFPVGLMLVLIAGAELFTGNNLMTLGVLKKRYSLTDMLRNWFFVYIGNLLGSLIMAVLVTNSGLYGGVIGEKAVAIAMKKVDIISSLGLMPLLSRAIICNIVVVLAVWMATGSKDIISKIFACWFPIMLFVLSGYEHSIANMFFLYAGKFVGADISTYQIWINNIIPVTIGNIIGGALFVPLVYYWIYLVDDGVESRKENKIA